MSPEQLAGARGRLSLRLLCPRRGALSDGHGRAAVRHQPRKALSRAIQRQPHMPMRQLAPHHPVQLERIIDTLLAKRPEDRYQSAGRCAPRSSPAARAERRRRSAPGPAPVGHVVAVLPFDVIGRGRRRDGALRDGLGHRPQQPPEPHEDLRVAPRTSTRALAGQSVRDIGRRLGVDMVIEGTIQRTAERLRVTANLIDAAHERAAAALRSSSTALFGDALATQDDIAARRCVTAWPRCLSRAPAQRYSQEPEAYHAFKRGQHLWKTCFEGGWRPAIEHYQHAIDRDPQFALAHVALASAYNFLGFYSLVKPTLAFAVAGEQPSAAWRSTHAGRGIRRSGARQVRRRLGLGWRRAGVQARPRRSMPRTRRPTCTIPGC